MITTLDNVVCKRGDIVWEIGLDGKKYRPTRSVVHGPIIKRLINEDRCWKDFFKCQEECDRLNKLENKKDKK